MVSATLVLTTAPYSLSKRSRPLIERSCPRRRPSTPRDTMDGPILPGHPAFFSDGLLELLSELSSDAARRVRIAQGRNCPLLVRSRISALLNSNRRCADWRHGNTTPSYLLDFRSKDESPLSRVLGPAVPAARNPCAIEDDHGDEAGGGISSGIKHGPAAAKPGDIQPPCFGFRI